jgi:hypothetical protein
VWNTPVKGELNNAQEETMLSLFNPYLFPKTPPTTNLQRLASGRDEIGSRTANYTSMSSSKLVSNPLVVITLLLTFSASRSIAAPLNNIPRETISEGRSGAGFGWTASYDIEFFNSSLNVDIDILLQALSNGVLPPPGTFQLNALKQTWEAGIESIWNNQFVIIKDGRWRYPISFNVHFMDQHHTVNVRRPSATINATDMTNWYTWDTGRVAAHEFGHMLGLFDEYSGGAVDPITMIVDNSSIMGSVDPTAVPKPRHFAQYPAWLSSKSPLQTFTIEPHVGEVDVVGALSNFDVVNDSGLSVNDFELTLGGVTSSDITGFYSGYGFPPTTTDFPFGVRIRWQGANIPAGEDEHFGVRLKSGVIAEGASATWTVNGLPGAPARGLGVQQSWAADGSNPNAIGSTIQNLSTESFFISRRFSFITDEPLELDDLTTDIMLDWQDEFEAPHLLAPGDFVYDIVQLDPPFASVVSQLRVFSPNDLVNPIVVYTNQATGEERAPTFGLVIGDFDLDNFWTVDDLNDMQMALNDPAGYLALTGLEPGDLVELGDLDGSGVFDNLDLNLAEMWVPTHNSLENEGPPVPEPNATALLVIGMALFFAVSGRF